MAGEADVRAYVAARNAELAAGRRHLKERLEGAAVERIVVVERHLGPFDDWPAPRPFLYCDRVVIRTHGGAVVLRADEVDGDLVEGLVVSGGIEVVSSDRIRTVTFGNDPSTGHVDGVALALEREGTLYLFTGEIEDDATGQPCIRRGDEMIFLFRSVEEAARLGLEFHPIP